MAIQNSEITKSLRVLWIGHVVPVPQNSGSRVYSAKIVSALRKAGADITYAGSKSDDFDVSLLNKLDKNVKWRVFNTNSRSLYRAVLSIFPLVVARMDTASMLMELRKLIEINPSFDIVVLENYAAGWAISEAKKLQRMGSKIVYLAHNDENLLARDIARDFRGSLIKKIFLFINWWKVKRLEGIILKHSNLLIALTETDELSLKNRAGSLNLKLESLIITPGYEGHKVGSRSIDADTPRQVVIMGSARWIAKQMNLESFLKVADKRFAAENIKIQIIGEMDEAFVSRWEKELVATEFCGFVDDLTAVLNKSRLGLVVETTGGGFKMKVLDYVFSRLPIAAISGSCQGLPLPVNNNLISSETVDQLVNIIITSIDNFSLLNAMQNGAFDAASSLFNWERNGKTFYEKLVVIRSK